MGLPWLGASESLTFLGMRVSKTASRNWFLTSSATPWRVGPDVVHGEDYAVEVEILVEVTLNQRNGPHELPHALQGVIFALDRDHEAVGGDRALTVRSPSEGGSR